ncbi:MAG TPA: hypothetical protein VG410_12200 [Solirubrobacteraceae bacterium]|nr:hypothetical protein [Solirubrobacteraceae bacterium]
MGQRSRKKGRREQQAGARPRPAAATVTKLAPSPRQARSEARNEAIRAGLKPLAPGERPWPIAVGAVLALLTGGVQLILFIAGVKLKVGGTTAKAGSTIVFGVMMFICAGGMWFRKYWAVLGFMAILGITVAYFALALIKASNVQGFAIGIAGITIGGFLFYKLVRVLSRLQMPQYPGR